MPSGGHAQAARQARHALLGTRKVIHEFNERALDSLDPDTLGEPFTRWSLVKLAAYLRKRGICEISPAHLGRGRRMSATPRTGR
jgi:hypothetical protein